jgi:hypothetical protein
LNCRQDQIAVLEPDEVVRGLRTGRKRVVTFAGYGELGYQDEPSLERATASVLRSFDPATTIVNTGTLLTEGFKAGIAAIYPVARGLGFETVGIHPSIALVHPKRHALAQAVNRVYFVGDPTWGGFLPGTRQLSQTLRTLLEASDELVAIGGGEHTAQEIEAFLAHGKPVRFFAAEMHRETTRLWCAEKRIPLPPPGGVTAQRWGEGGTLHA